MTPRTPSPRRLALVAAALLAASLAGCGRRGPPELPPETQARGAYLKAQEEARQAKAAKGARPAPGAEEADRPPPPIPGTIGNRPPEQYPFVLDPLL